ncbi:hypothetical protein ACSBR1_008082 [Camellia fascicularis]
MRLNYSIADGNNLTLKTSNNWVPPFQVELLVLASWQLGPQFTFILKSSKLGYLSISNNQIRGEIPKMLEVVASHSILDLSSNHFEGLLPPIPSNAFWLDLSNNNFAGSIYHVLCGRGKNPNMLRILNLGDN